jgi:hypothetical protein
MGHGVSPDLHAAPVQLAHLVCGEDPRARRVGVRAAEPSRDDEHRRRSVYVLQERQQGVQVVGEAVVKRQRGQAPPLPQHHSTRELAEPGQPVPPRAQLPDLPVQVAWTDEEPVRVVRQRNVCDAVIRERERRKAVRGRLPPRA